MASSTIVNISGLDKIEVLHVLWENAQIAGIFGRVLPIIRSTQVFDRERAEGAVQGYIDDFNNRFIKCDFRSDDIDVRLYDRDNGDGAAKKLIESLRK